VRHSSHAFMYFPLRHTLTCPPPTRVPLAEYDPNESPLLMTSDSWTRFVLDALSSLCNHMEATLVFLGSASCDWL
jgi:hypothetical protein